MSRLDSRLHPPTIARPDQLRLPLLVTGVAGVAGYNALRYFQTRYPGQVIGARRSDNWALQGEGIEACDMHDADRLQQLCSQYRFESVLNCEGTCKLKSCELDPPLAWRVNVLSVASLLETIAPTARLVHLSIDLVFSGTADGNHVEADPTDPVTIYGKTMQQTEQLVLQARPDACVLRISLPMGVSFNGHAGAIDWIQSRFAKARPATLYFDEIRTPTYCDCLNRTCETVLASSLAGLYHAGGPRRLSLYQIGQIVNRVGGYDPDLLMGCPRGEAGPVPPRAGDVSMDSRSLEAALGCAPFDPWPLADEHVPTNPDWHRHGPRGSRQLLEQVLYQNPRYQ